MNTVFEIVRHTPVWVFFLFAGLVALGARRMRAADVPVRQLLLLPVAMTAFSLFGLWQAFGASTIASLGWTVAFVAAIAIGWNMAFNARVRVVQYSPPALQPVSQPGSKHIPRRVHVPGSALPLALMMTIFFLRYVVAVSLAMHPSLRLDTAFVVGVALLYGLTSGAFAARATHTLRSAFRRDGRAPTEAAA